MDAAARVSNPIHVDEQLRANPDDLVALMRAGRLAPERVAMAAYLGDERALATGVEPWVPPPSYRTSVTARLLEAGGLTRREGVWLACLCAERRLSLDDGGPESAEAMRVTRAWCRGQADESEVVAVLSAVTQAEDVAGPTGGPTSGRTAAILATSTALSDWTSEDETDTPANVALLVALRDPAEQAWQAQAIAAVLLDPEWPPWDE